MAENTTDTSMVRSCSVLLPEQPDFYSKLNRGGQCLTQDYWSKALRQTTARKQPHLQENNPLVISSHIDPVLEASCWQQYFSKFLNWAMWEHCHGNFSQSSWQLGLLSCSKPWDFCCFKKSLNSKIYQKTAQPQYSIKPVFQWMDLENNRKEDYKYNQVQCCMDIKTLKNLCLKLIMRDSLIT